MNPEKAKDRQTELCSHLRRQDQHMNNLRAAQHTNTQNNANMHVHHRHSSARLLMYKVNLIVLFEIGKVPV